MSTLSSANVTDVNLVLKERTHMRLCLNMLIFTNNLGNWLISDVLLRMLQILWEQAESAARSRAWRLRPRFLGIHGGDVNMTSLCSAVWFLFCFFLNYEVEIKCSLVHVVLLFREHRGCPIKVLYYCEHGGVDLVGLKLNPYDLSFFSVLTLLVGSFDP